MNRPDHDFRLDLQFDAQAARTAEQIALLSDAGAITFRELSDASSRLARAIRASGLDDGSLVGLHMERSVHYVVSVLALLKANCTVVPLPPSYPAGRLRDILSYAGLDAVIDDEDTRLPPALHHRILPFTVGDASAIDADINRPGSSDQPAFVLCSSGSTGTPKMIVRSHRSFFHRLQWTWDTHPYAPDEVCVQKAHMTTTHAIYELFEPLLRGTPVRFVSDQDAKDLSHFWEMIVDHGVTRLLIVPSVLQASFDMPGFVPPRIRVLVLMGEYVNPKLAARAAAAFPDETCIYSIYGSTEASSTLLCDVKASLRAGEELPLGRPISPDVHVHLLDAGNEPVKANEIGMLYISGPPLFTEYLKDATLTAASFLDGTAGGERLFRTHDQVRSMPDGALQFIGRIDHTVKIRGFRVDLQEVERAMLQHPDVRQCTVIVKDGADGDAMLLAFVSPSTVPPAAIYQRLRDQLPAYMVPSAVVGLDDFPRTPSGKVDRRRLLEQVGQPAPASAADAAQSATERRVAQVWTDVLQYGAVHADSNFFEVGGTSLKVFAVAERLRQAFALERRQLSDVSIYQTPTVDALAAYIDSLLDGREPTAPPQHSILVTLKTGKEPALPPLFAIASAGGTVGAYEKISRALATPHEVIGVRDPFLWGQRDPVQGFQHWIALYVQAIRERQPQGPYYLMAYSSGGAFGYEVARQLRQAGQEVALLALLDPVLIDSGGGRRFGYWATRARSMPAWQRRLVLHGGQVLAQAQRWFAGSSPNAGGFEHAYTPESLRQQATAARSNKQHIINLSALLELNTGLPFALTRADLSDAPADRYVQILLDKVRSVAPDVETEMIEQIVVQYGMQSSTQYTYELAPYDGNTVLFTTDGPHQGLLAAVFRPYVRKLRVRVLPVGPQTDRVTALSQNFAEGLRLHFQSMRDDLFVSALADELKALLPGASARASTERV